MPAYNEEEGIYNTVKDFLNQEVVDEVIVVDNNSKDNTAKEAKSAGAIVYFEPKQGYGYAVQKAFRMALTRKADIIVNTESDSTFLGRDVYKLLPYLEDVDMVCGSRTHKVLVDKNAKMGPFLWWGNFALAKLLQFLYGSCQFTDIQCSLRAIRRNELKKIMPYLNEGGSTFLTQMTILAINKRLDIIEVPINYSERVGQSKITSTTFKSLIVGFKIIASLFKHKIMRGQ